MGASHEIQVVNVAGMQRAGVHLIGGTDAGIGPSKLAELKGLVVPP